MSKRKSSYRPTRLCPHRWCMPLHTLLGLMGAAVAIRDIWADWRLLLLMAALGAGSYLLHRIIFNRPMSDLVMAEAAHEGTGGRRLVVRPGWARAAAILDMVMVTLGAVMVAATVQGEVPAGKAEDVSAGPPLFAMGGLAVYLFVHKRATDPVRPSRVAAWVRSALGRRAQAEGS